MKKVAIGALAFLLVFGTTALAGDRCVTIHGHHDWHDDADLDEVEIDLDGDVVVLEHERFDNGPVEITKEYELFVDDRQVKLDAERQEMVRDYYDLVTDIHDEAKAIGWEGAKVGVEGAKLGVTAIGRLVKMLLTSYDEDDFERDMERDAEEIEKRAESLEEQAEVIEEMAYDLEDLTYLMFDEVDELRDLDWF